MIDKKGSKNKAGEVVRAVLALAILLGFIILVIWFLLFVGRAVVGVFSSPNSKRQDTTETSEPATKPVDTSDKYLTAGSLAKRDVINPSAVVVTWTATNSHDVSITDKCIISVEDVSRTYDGYEVVTVTVAPNTTREILTSMSVGKQGAYYANLIGAECGFK